MGNDAPPQYFAPPANANANKMYNAQGTEMPMYGSQAPQGPQGMQQSGVVGSGSGNADVEQGQSQTQGEALPPRPAKARIMGAFDRFRK